MSEEQEATATAEATADQAETQESQATSEAGGSQTNLPGMNRLPCLKVIP